MDFSIFDDISTQPLRVLILGDGNFSYSNLLLQHFTVPRKRRVSTQRHIIHSRPIAVVCTVYDSEEIQHSKYINSVQYENSIRLYGGAVLYNIDATNIQQSLQIAINSTNVLQRTIDIQTQQPGSDKHRNAVIDNLHQQYNAIFNDSKYRFDVVIFNHPHSGSEDLIRHQQLLAHFLHSAKQCVSNTGVLYVILTLCNLQPNTWLLHRSIALHGYTVVKYYQFNPKQIPQWEQKRHHTAKQFTNKVNSEIDSELSELQHCYWLKFDRNNTTAQTSSINATNDDTNLHCAICDTQCTNIESMITHWSALQPEQYATNKYECSYCGKQYIDERSYQQHIQYAQHKDIVK